MDDRTLNLIGAKFFDAPDSEKKRFIEVAKEKAIELGSKQTNFYKLFYETHSRCPLSNVYTYFFHAAHVVWGINFDLTVKARSAHSTTVYTNHQGKETAITIETL